MRPQNKLLLGSVTALASLLGALAWAWFGASPWDRPAAPILLVFGGWAAFVAGTTYAPDERAHPSRWFRAVGLGALAVATLTLMVLIATGALGRWRFEATLAELESRAHEILAGASDPGYECAGAPAYGRYGRLGTPDEICISVHDDPVAGAAVRRVQFGWGPRFLVYEDGVATPPTSRCRAHLSNAWWAEAQADPGCPLGFSFLARN